MRRCENCCACVTTEELRKADLIYQSRLDLCVDCAEALKFAIDGELEALAGLIEAQFELA